MKTGAEFHGGAASSSHCIEEYDFNLTMAGDIDLVYESFSAVNFLFLLLHPPFFVSDSWYTPEVVEVVMGVN
jgi:hypothetical protein